MKAISLFSGVEGFGIGLGRAGIETVLQAERDPWCLEVLTRHYPNTERVTDVRSVGLGRAEHHIEGESHDLEARQPVTSWSAGDVGLIYGGFPCQDLSVAGQRAGLGGERSGLWFEFHRVLRELRPRWAVIENVPGLLSSDSGRDFAVILAGLDDLGFDVAWAVLDAQHFGVPQRRRRVFIVAGPRGRGPEQVLSLCESCGGNPATGRAAGEDVAGTLTSGSADSQRGFRNDFEGTGAFVVAKSLRAQGNDPHREDASTYVVSKTLGTSHGVDNLAHAIAVHTAQTGSNGWGIGTDEQAYTLDGAQGQAVNGVRRLTPRECERLMGWPDDWTRWTADGREIADSHRYRMCGNGVVATVAEWIGHRLMAVDGALND